MRVQNKHEFVGGLVILGIAACACLFLTKPVGERRWSGDGVGVAVLVAKRALPAMTVVTLDDFVRQSVSKNELPQGQGQLTTPTRVIGRVLAMPVVEGQILRESCFISDGTGAQVVAAIPEGMRAVTLNLDSRAVPDRLFLYPGSVVDVLFSFRSSSKSVGEAGALTILSGIQVVAVNGESIVSDPEQDENARMRRVAARLQVTVLLDQKQAEALQVLGDKGNISLTVRNPLDKTMGDMEAPVLSPSQLVRLSSLLIAQGVTAPQRERAMREWLAAEGLVEKDPNQADPANPSQNVEGNSYMGTVPTLPSYLEKQYKTPLNIGWGLPCFAG